MLNERLTIVYVIDQEGRLPAEDGEMLRKLRVYCDRASEADLLVFDVRNPAPEEEPQEFGELRARPLSGYTPAQCYNAVLGQDAPADPRSGWIHFLRCGVSYDVDQIDGIIAAAGSRQAGQENDRYDAVCMTPVQITDGRESAAVRRKEGPVTLSAGGRDGWNPVAEAFFFRREAIGDLRFPESSGFADESAFLFLAEYLAKSKSYYLHPAQLKIRRFLMTDPDGYRPAFAKAWYTRAVADMDRLLRKSQDASEADPGIYEMASYRSIFQSGILYLIERRLHANRNNRNKEVLTAEEVKEFFSAVSDLMKRIDDEVIMGTAEEFSGASAFQKVLSLFLLRLKYRGSSCEAAIAEGGRVELAVNAGGAKDLLQIPAGTVSDTVLQVDAINYREHALWIDGELKNVAWARYDALQVFAQCAEHQIAAESTGICRFEKLFGQTIWRACMIRFRLPEEMLRAHSIAFFADYKGHRFPCRKILFARIQARLHHKYNSSYWVFGRFILSRGLGDPQTLQIEPYSRAAARRLERALQKEIRDPSLRRLRKLYHLTAPLLRGKRIWITYDQLYKGGDNGEYFYQYVRKEHPEDVRMYYLANEAGLKRNPSWRKDPHVLTADSKNRRQRYRMQLLALHADQIFSTRASVDSFFGFHRNAVRAAVTGLYNAEVSCIQHGLTVQKIAQYQNRLQDNMKQYYCASDFERELLCRPVFGYTPEAAVITGSPRYDGLLGTEEKQILITPTWRRNVTDGMRQKGSEYTYNPSFRESEYYRIYDRLLTDERLLECAKETGYRILFVLHPNIGAQERDFHSPDPVQIINGVDADYEQLMVRSQLMVTDYSGIQFDFAYMRRPLVYYRPDCLPPQYEEGVRYEDMQFGPVAKDHETVVACLCEMMRNHCAVADEYRETIERFFPFDDRSNCERVYQGAWEYQRQIEEDRK